MWDLYNQELEEYQKQLKQQVGAWCIHVVGIPHVAGVVVQAQQTACSDGLV